MEEPRLVRGGAPLVSEAPGPTSTRAPEAGLCADQAFPLAFRMDLLAIGSYWPPSDHSEHVSRLGPLPRRAVTVHRCRTLYPVAVSLYMEVTVFRHRSGRGPRPGHSYARCDRALLWTDAACAVPEQPDGEGALDPIPVRPTSVNFDAVVTAQAAFSDGQRIRRT